ncbi:hypothetical protein [Wolbachia endosymbiont (group A) of Bibio marci]|nr:hypothetical protein [Wolbachia endosymbiont (group A) of Bibio marci]
MQQSHPSVKHWNDTFVFEVKSANTLPLRTNVRTAVCRSTGMTPHKC